VFYLKGKTKLIGTEGMRLLLRKARLGETPQAKAEEAPRPPVESEPYVPINVQIVQAHKNGQTR
jgi:hypothetical protein